MKQKKYFNLSQFIIYGFLVLLVLGVYLIETRNGSRIAELLSSATPDPSPTPSATPEAVIPVGIALDTLLSALTEDGLDLSKGSEPNIFTLRDPEGTGRMRLVLSLNDDRVSALTLDFPMPEALPDQTRKTSHYNALTQQHAEKELTKVRSSLERILYALSSSISGDALPADTLIHWFDGASASMESGKSFESKEIGFQLQVDPATTPEGREILRISIRYR